VGVGRYIKYTPVHAFYLLRLQQTETHYIPINDFWSNLIENMPGQAVNDHVMTLKLVNKLLERSDSQK